jgi:hypothetical protein
MRHTLGAEQFVTRGDTRQGGQPAGEQVARDALGITTGTRWVYGCGGAGYGVLYNAHYFVLIYYSQVLGLDAGLAGLAVGISLVADAITDPLIGYLSDSTRSSIFSGIRPASSRAIRRCSPGSWSAMSRCAPRSPCFWCRPTPSWPNSPGITMNEPAC